MPKVPGAAIGINVGVGGVREGAVDTLAFLWLGRPVYLRPGEWMTEPHLPAGLDQPGLGRRCRCRGLDAELTSRTPHQNRVGYRFGRSYQ